MGRRTTLTLLLLALALGAYIWFVERRAPSPDDERAAARRAVRFDPETVTRVSVLSGGNEVTVQRNGNAWSLIRPVAARADAALVHALVDELAGLERAGFVTARERRERRLADGVYGLDYPRARVVMDTASGPVAVRIGGNAPVGGTLFIQREGLEDVAVVSTNLLAVLPHAAADWRERRLVRAPAGPLSRLEVRRADGFVQMARAPGGDWRLQKPVEGRADRAVVEVWLQRLYEVRIEEFVADSVAGAALYGLDEPQAQVVLTGTGGEEEQTLLVGREMAGDPSRVYATLRGTESVYGVSTSVLSALRVPLDRLRDRRVLPWTPGSLRYVEVARGDRKVALVCTNAADWEILGPQRQAAEATLVWSAIATWAGARINAFHDDQATNLAAWGLAPPAAVLTLAVVPEPGTNAFAAGDAQTLLLGQPSPTGAVFALEPASRTVWQVPRELLDLAQAEARHYRARPAFTLNPAEIRSVEIRQGDRALTWLRSGTNGDAWAVEPSGHVDRAEVESWLDFAGRLRAREWVAEDAADLGSYGLAPPAAAVTIGLTGESGLAKVLLLGGPAGTGAVHAVVKGQDAVFTLEEAARDKLMRPLYKPRDAHDGNAPDPEPAAGPAATP